MSWTTRSFNIPWHYDDNRIVLMVRDPWTLFSYWEIRHDVENRVKDEIRGKNLAASKSVLRVYDVTDGLDNLPSKISFDFELKDWADSWYIHSNNPGRKFMVEIGIIATNGEFFVLARSNVVTAPPFGLSNVFDEEWMCPDDFLTRMFPVGLGSFKVKEMLERYLKKWLFSGRIVSGMFGSASMFRRKKK